MRKVNVDKVIEAYRESDYDPEGSYTGKSEISEVPTQDVDDL